MAYYISCPHCDGEKVLEENHVGPGRWYPEDGYYIDEPFSCDCPLTDAEFEAMQMECDKQGWERVGDPEN